MSIKNKSMYIENLNETTNPFYTKTIKQSDTEIYNIYKPYSENTSFSFNDEKIKYGENFSIYKKDDYGKDYIKIIENSRGKVKLSNDGDISYYPNDSEMSSPYLIDTDPKFDSLPGVLGINKQNNLILAYLKYDFNSGEFNKNTFCGNSLVLFDFNKKIPQAITFGVFQGCDLFKSVKFIGNREAIIEIEPNLVFHYKNGIMQLPKKENFKVILKEQKDNFHDPMRSSNSLDINKQGSDYVYKYFFPYSKKENIPLKIAEVFSFPTTSGELKFIQNYYSKHFIQSNDNEIFTVEDFILKYRDDEHKYFIGNIFSYLNDEKRESKKDLKCASHAVLIDATYYKPTILKFGVNNACNEIIKVEKNRDKVFTTLVNGNIFEYSDGEMKLPKENSNYKLSFPESFRSIDTLKTGSDLYKKFPPYSFLIEEEFDYK
jgi:hypothetical protein